MTFDPRIIQRLNNCMQVLKPKEGLNALQWADRYFYLPAAAGNPTPGPYSSARRPWQRGILEAVSNPKVQRITLKIASQMGKSTVMCAIACFFLHWKEASTLVYFPNDRLLKEFSTTRFTPTFEQAPAFKGLLGKSTERSVTNNPDLKILNNGASIYFLNTSSAADLKGKTAPIVLMDEIDENPRDIGGQGDSIALGKARLTEYGSTGKLILCSTPTTTDNSLIDISYEESNKGLFYVPCPHCKQLQYLEMRLKDGDGNWKYYFKIPEKRPELAYFECQHCEKAIKESSLPWMMANGEWVFQNPNVTNHYGFEISTFYSTAPNCWSGLAEEWLQACSGGPTKLKAFVNTRLARSFSDYKNNLEGLKALQERGESRTNYIPREVAYLTLGVDMQHDRIEATLIGHGRGEQVYAIDHFRFYGETTSTQCSPYLELASLISRKFIHPSGAEMPVAATFVDCGDGQAGRSQVVMDFCKTRHHLGVRAIKGSSTEVKDLFKDSASKSMTPFVLLDSNQQKGWVLHRLNSKQTYFHFPKNDIFNLAYFEQLQNEIYVGGRYKLRKDHLRNEALDCLVYATAAWEYAKRKEPRLGDIEAKLQAFEAIAQKPKLIKVGDNIINEKTGEVLETVTEEVPNPPKKESWSDIIRRKNAGNYYT